MTIELTYNPDINSPSFGACDISFTDGNPLSTAVLMSLFSWRRVSVDELDADGSVNRYGWWTDTPDRKLGSKLWLLRRKSITQNVIPLVRDYIQEALQWMIDDGMCSSVNINVSHSTSNPEYVLAEIAINKEDGTSQTVQFADLWSLLK